MRYLLKVERYLLLVLSFLLFTPLKASHDTLSIYDRWGNRLFYRENCNSDCSWDGSRNGQILDDGIYVFTARLKYLDGVVVSLSGEVNLLDSDK